MEVIAYAPEHLKALLLQPAQEYMRAMVRDDEYCEILAKCGPSYTAIHDGRIVACCGVQEHWATRGTAWAVLAADAGKYIVSVHKAVSRFLTITPYTRIEAAVDVKFEAAHRWVKALGFVYEGTMHKYAPDGRDCALYARIK